MNGNINNTTFTIPEKLLFFITEKKRYKIAYGGRAGAKTDSVAVMLLIEMLRAPVSTMQNKVTPFVVLVVRETLESIADSCHATFVKYIDLYNLNKFFKITENKIICTINNSYIIFKGIRNRPTEIKSLQGVMRCWVEEAANVSRNSWDILIPTIRAEGSEIWITFNPINALDETYQRFVANPHPDSIVVNVNFYDNPFNNSDTLKEIKNWKLFRPEDYEHIFLGKVKEYSEALIFKNKFQIKEFKEHNWAETLGHKFYYGADWGFAKDPTCLIRCFIKEELLENTEVKVKNLYIDYEVGGIGIELTQIKAMFQKIPDIEKYFERKTEYRLENQLGPITIYGDSSRPDIISFLRNEGLPLYECYKTKIEDGIDFLKSFYKIYIHPRCKETIREFQNYSYKINKNNGKILPEVDDKAGVDHYIDALRYSLSDLIKNGMLARKYMTSYDWQKAIANFR
jgi:phage terminase large subunit